MLIAEQIKERLETAFLPHKATARIHDYGAKITFRVQSKDGAPLFLGPDWSVDELREDFEGRITGIWREIEHKLKRG